MSLEKQEYLQIKGEIAELKEEIEKLDMRITGCASAIRSALPFAVSPEDINIGHVEDQVGQLKQALTDHQAAKAKKKKLEDGIGLKS
jgi:tRNA U34 5-carboxymethylaminomethyl modifying GTPase MnmE/TrmE